MLPWLYIKALSFIMFIFLMNYYRKAVNQWCVLHYCLYTTGRFLLYCSVSALFLLRLCSEELHTFEWTPSTDQNASIWSSLRKSLSLFPSFLIVWCRSPQSCSAPLHSDWTGWPLPFRSWPAAVHLKRFLWREQVSSAAVIISDLWALNSTI